VAAARALVAGYRPDRPDRGPAFTYTPSGSPAARSEEARSEVAISVTTGGDGSAGNDLGPVTAAAADLRAGVVTSVQLVEDSLLAVEKHDGELMAVVHLMDRRPRRGGRL
jgi:hypothetical protein